MSTTQQPRPAQADPLDAQALGTGHMPAHHPAADDGVVLRPAVDDDALCLSVLAMQVFLDTYATQGIRPALAREVLSAYSEAVFAEALRHPAACITVAERAGHLIGFAHITLGAGQPLVPAGRPSELLRLYVQQPYTGQRVGTRLLAQAEHKASQAGSEVLWLTPWVHNHRALGFYASRGYADFGLTIFSFEGESHQNRVLAKALPAARDRA